MSTDQRAVVTVFGHSQATPGTPAWQNAYDLGREIALAGWTLCNGGYGGTMEAAARGACEAGGTTIGVTCSALPLRCGPNAYIQREIPTGELSVRLQRLIDHGRAYVVLPGGTGTLLELALVWELVSKGMLGRAAPIVLFGSFWAGLNDVVRSVQPSATELPVVETAAAAVALIRALWREQVG
jgi:uncharacterized protein (TIGR00730 family)